MRRFARVLSATAIRAAALRSETAAPALAKLAFPALSGSFANVRPANLLFQNANSFHTSALLRGSDSDDEASDYEYEEGICYPAARVAVGKPAPGFTAPAVVDGEIKKVSLSEYLKKGKYVVLFFYPKDFTFVCPTEIIAFSDRAKEFEALNCQVLAASTDTEECHLAWIKTARNRGGLGYMQIPIIADTTKEISARYGVLMEQAGIALRGLFIINPHGVVQQVTINDLPIGRSVDETLRLLQAIQFHAEHGEVCPANWKPGEKTMVADAENSLEYFASADASHAEEEFGQKLTPITSKKQYEELVSSGKPVVIDFFAPWCGKCRMLAPYVDELLEAHRDITFAKFDTTHEALEALSGELGVKALPAFKFFRGGKEAVPQVVGYKKKPLGEAVAALAKA